MEHERQLVTAVPWVYQGAGGSRQFIISLGPQCSPSRSSRRRRSPLCRHTSGPHHSSMRSRRCAGTRTDSVSPRSSSPATCLSSGQQTPDAQMRRTGFVRSVPALFHPVMILLTKFSFFRLLYVGVPRHGDVQYHRRDGRHGRVDSLCRRTGAVGGALRVRSHCD